MLINATGNDVQVLKSTVQAFHANNEAHTFTLVAVRGELTENEQTQLREIVERWLLKNRY
jgi:hypothetical protein